ncbi:alpha-1,2-mannosyltransferase [Coprinopsis cinerea okayama7|uniref:Alpha-1,2-mannosyltransferase n=1 Tax=Coprinopsis cinerea (strain Okayama-7 / 130 / ATCC MYA-4618 / FGSC 9003) TaxID=240176 RepID=A8P213_COPC7|nr:alpha-1,2-mannosyltransferase [Coprinopsis cinerea okayama7\|eukprot:XP_001838218.1 alpha-1,2-mannosyltransferase [Coprinopsis cinerea okayama7\
MNTPTRYILLALFLIISLHYLLAFTHEAYGRATALDHLKDKIVGPAPKPHVDLDTLYGPDVLTGDAPLKQDKKANATFVILCRNSDMGNIVRSVREIEDRFNRYHRYPYVFLNEEPFSEEFKMRLSVLSAAKMEFGQIPRDHWYQPDWIDEEKAKASREKMVKEKVIYGGSVSYRNMCRFNSGFFFRHPLMLKYRWYWRIEPDVHFHCNINHDPFLYMQEHNKTYGFTITLYEYERTIPTLWGHVQDFMKENPQYVAEDNALGFMSERNGEKYNLCHFWSNFEIADMEFWRSPAYMDFFNYLDSKGGFYYERWGDAPVHSIAAAIFLNKNQIHFFDEIGYEHAPYTHCPKLGKNWENGRCSCDQKKSFDYDGYSCMRKWDAFMGLPSH